MNRFPVVMMFDFIKWFRLDGWWEFINELRLKMMMMIMIENVALSKAIDQNEKKRNETKRTSKRMGNLKENTDLFGFSFNF